MAVTIERLKHEYRDKIETRADLINIIVNEREDKGTLVLDKITEAHGLLPESNRRLWELLERVKNHT